MYVMGYADSPTSRTVVDSQDFKVKEFGRRLLTERRMTRSTMAEAREALGDFHTSDIRPKTFELNPEDRAKIENLCTEIRDVLMATKASKSRDHLSVRVKKRQEIEALKVGVLYNELITRRDEGYSVIIFVNFRKTLDALITMTRKKWPSEQYADQFSVIVGGQEASVRLKQVELFQTGKNKILLAMITAGGTGISLHDTIGGHPRYTLISPPESATVAMQAFGRVDRIGAKTDSVQRMIFIKDTIEEKIADSLNKKIQTIGDLNGDDEGDNLFLYEVYHEYEAKEEEEEDLSNKTIQIATDTKAQKILVGVPDYMISSFEEGIPTQCTPGMQIRGDKYIFDLKHKTDLLAFLKHLNE